MNKESEENKGGVVLTELDFWICAICGRPINKNGEIISVPEEIIKKNGGRQSHGWCLDCGLKLGWVSDKH